MVDIPSAEAVAGSALGLSVLKPSADLIGEKLRDNLDRVIRKAEKRLGPDGLKRPGEVPLRVLKAVRDEGVVCESELEAEYLGGVLASSRTEISRDDRAASLIALLSRLSTYQMRSHYIFYALAQRSLAGEDINLGMQTDRERAARFYIPHQDWRVAMDLSEQEESEWDTIFPHVLHGLIREALIEDHFAYGPPDSLRGAFAPLDYPSDGLIFTISPLGVELFVAAHGVAGQAVSVFIDPELSFEIEEPIELGQGFGPLKALLPYTPTDGQSGGEG